MCHENTISGTQCAYQQLIVTFTGTINDDDERHINRETEREGERDALNHRYVRICVSLCGAIALFNDERETRIINTGCRKEGERGRGREERIIK